MQQQSHMKSQTNKKVTMLSMEDIQNQLKRQKQNDSDQEKQPNSSYKLKRCNLREGCQNIQNYKRLNKIHQGNYGVVYRALEIPTNKIYAVKKLKLVDGADFPITSLRQISILRSLDHPNIMKITRVAGSPQRDKVYIVMEYADHQLKELLKQVQFKQPQIRRLMKDLLQGMAYLHDRKIVHRDLKTSNLLYENEGILKICDFGLARKASQAIMTQQVITMWYRPPQLLLGQYCYSTELDIWSVGCIMAQIILRDPIFKGKTQLQQLDLIFRAVGSPTQESWPDIKSFKNYMYVIGKKYPNNKISQMIPKQLLSLQGVNLLKLLLTPNPKKRISAKKALNHAWFKQEISPRENMPKHTPINQLDRVRKKVKTQHHQSNKDTK